MRSICRMRPAGWQAGLLALLMLAGCAAPTALPTTAVATAVPSATQPAATTAAPTVAPTQAPATAAATATPVPTMTPPAATAAPAPTATPMPAVPTATRVRETAGLPLQTIKLPAGFAIEVYAAGVQGARSMTLSPSGVLFVGTRDVGKLYAILDRNQDQHADEVITIAQGLDSPNGVAFRDGALYVAEINRVLRYDGIEARLNNPPAPVVVNDSFPSDALHGWKFIRFGPDGKMYVPVGAPCNICIPDARHASIFRMNPDGSGLEVFASGIRNTVGFDWHPATQELWFTDNGRDLLGDDLPPDELNRAPAAGMNFGYPYCHGGTIADPTYGTQHKCSEFTPPVQALGPHVASLGMRFYTGKMFAAQYQGQIFIAEHGSWNRSVPIGYRVTLVRLDGNKSAGYEVFAEGWLQGSSAWGRPVDVQVMPDGALLVSDDMAGVVYRISYR